MLSTVKQPVTRRTIRWVRKNAPDFLPRMIDRQPNGEESLRFWQRNGGYDRNLWTPKHIWETIDYIHANPVEAGLVKRPEEWRWSSASEYLERGCGLLRIDREKIPGRP
jgi:REP element-mobilizing transposase RayT